jgi:hypothetical protein
VEVQTVAIRGTYNELVDAAEDLGDVLSATLLDLTPVVRTWLGEQLELIELALVQQLDGSDGADGRQERRGVPALHATREGAVA